MDKLISELIAAGYAKYTVAQLRGVRGVRGVRGGSPRIVGATFKNSFLE